MNEAAELAPLLGHIEGAVTPVIAAGADDQDGGCDTVTEPPPDAAGVVPRRSTAVPSPSADTDPMQRDRPLQISAERGRLGWQPCSGNHYRAKAGAARSRYKRVIGDTLRSRAGSAWELETRIGGRRSAEGSAADARSRPRCVISTPGTAPCD